MVTTSAFPVSTLTVVTVSCDEGYQLNGDETITCEKDTTFTYETQPSCVEIGKMLYKS